jgi:flagellar basal-body rod modification protein FlgD
MMTTINSDYYLKTNAVKISETGDNSALGKDAFLQILITQLQNQDPTSPMDDKEFIAQMAQFSSLEQMQNMTSAMEKLLSSQQETQLLSYTNFIGKEVKWSEVTNELDEKGNPIVKNGAGTVSELQFDNGSPIFVLEDGKKVTPGNIAAITNNGLRVSEAAENPLVTASNLIGSKISYNANDVAIEALIESIVNSKSGIEYILNNGSRLTRDQFTLI